MIDFIGIKVIAEELSNKLKGSIFQKARVVPGLIYRFKLYSPGQGNVYLFSSLDGKITLTKLNISEMSLENKFTQKINHELKNAKIEFINQLNNDRIIEIKFNNEKKLIFELFPRGNIILTDNHGKILFCAKEMELKDRTIKPGIEYQPPPKFIKLPKIYGNRQLEDILKKVENKKTYIYRTENKKIILPLLIEELKNNVEIVDESFYEYVMKFYEQEIYNIIQLESKKIKNKSLEKRKKVIEEMKENLKKIDEKINKVEQIISYIEYNYDKLEELITTLEKMDYKNKLNEVNEFLTKISKGKAKIINEKGTFVLEIDK